MRDIRKILKDNIKAKKKNIDDKLNEILANFYEKLFKRSLTTIGSCIRVVRSECYGESGEFDEKEYLKRLKKFYYYEFEDKCLSLGWNYNKELLLRRKELKNQSTFLANVTISVATGVVAGVLANNIFKVIFFMSSIDDTVEIAILKFVAIGTIIIITFLLPLFLFILFKNSITIIDPIIGYTEEIEIEIIEKFIRERLVFEDKSMGL